MSAEHDRRIGAMTMIGVIAELDEAQARVRVEADGLLTEWLPWVERRAGPGLRTWSAPEVGEQVLVVCIGGDPAQGVVVGSIYQDDHDAPASAKAVARAEFADGTVVEYDRAAHRLTVDVGEGFVVVNCKTATVAATESVTLDTPKTYATGDLQVTGKIDAGGNITTPAEVYAGSIGLKSHKHPTAGNGPPSTPIP